MLGFREFAGKLVGGGERIVASVVEIEGVMVDVTFAVEGWYSAGTLIDPPEAEWIELRTARIGGVDVMAFAEVLDIEGAIYAQRS